MHKETGTPQAQKIRGRGRPPKPLADDRDVMIAAVAAHCMMLCLHYAKRNGPEVCREEADLDREDRLVRLEWFRRQLPGLSQANARKKLERARKAMGGFSFCRPHLYD